MFDMKSIGIKIAQLRKAKNLTQMELADLLNISYQAVSNWERGQTMPDISKLPELARIFETTIDSIIGDSQDMGLINNIINDKISESAVTMDAFKSVAPLLKPSHINEISNRIEITDNASDIADYLPLVSRETADSIARKCMESDKVLLDKFMPFVSRECADKLVKKAMELDYPFEDLVDALPFISRDVADKIARKCMESDKVLLDKFMPFVSRECADMLILKAMEMDYPFGDLAPFITNEVADKIAQRGWNSKKVRLDEFMPFVSRECADKLVKKAMELDYPLEDLVDALPFISRDVADKIARKCMESDKVRLDEFMPFVSRECADMLVKKAAEKSK